MTRPNYKAPLIKSLGEAGLSTLSCGTWARTTFTYLRKNGTRKVKLWLASDVFDAPRKVQEKLERRLKINYGDAYLTAYFIETHPLRGMSFVVILDNSKM